MRVRLARLANYRQDKNHYLDVLEINGRRMLVRIEMTTWRLARDPVFLAELSGGDKPRVVLDRKVDEPIKQKVWRLHFSEVPNESDYRFTPVAPGPCARAG